jgi:hypothetical protein
MAPEVIAYLQPNAPFPIHELLAFYLDIDINLSSQIMQNSSSSATTLDLPSHVFEVSAILSTICEPPCLSTHHLRTLLDTQIICSETAILLEPHLADSLPSDAILPLSWHLGASLNNLFPNRFSDGFEVKNMVLSTNVLPARHNTFWGRLCDSASVNGLCLF